jgi:hypothetical protein
MMESQTQYEQMMQTKLLFQQQQVLVLEEEQYESLSEVCAEWYTEIKGCATFPADKLYRGLRYASKHKFRVTFNIIIKFFAIWCIHSVWHAVERTPDPAMYYNSSHQDTAEAFDSTRYLKMATSTTGQPSKSGHIIVAAQAAGAVSQAYGPKNVGQQQPNSNNDKQQPPLPSVAAAELWPIRRLGEGRAKESIDNASSNPLALVGGHQRANAHDSPVLSAAKRESLHKL